MKETHNLLEWLMEGDPSIQYQTIRDLHCYSESEKVKMQEKIASQGWGRQLLELRDIDTKMWGNGIYSPKWISTHYTLLQLKDMGISPANEIYIESSELLLQRLWQGKQNKNRGTQDVCVSAMLISICSYCIIQSEKIYEIMDYLLDKQYPDGGWNCNWYRGDIHSSVHTTISVLEAFRDYETSGYIYRLEEIKAAVPKGEEFLLRKHLFRSEHSGEIIHKTMLMLSYPCRWKYDILRSLDYFQSVGRAYDPRMEEALKIILSKRRKDGFWPVQYKHAGLVHFDMEETGEASRWNTLRALRVLKAYKPEDFKRAIEW